MNIRCYACKYLELCKWHDKILDMIKDVEMTDALRKALVIGCKNFQASTGLPGVPDNPDQPVFPYGDPN